MDIAIIGGGVGGLTLACVLHRHGVEAIVYEREFGPDSRGQGGSLDLHPDSGQRALAEAGLADAFTGLARPEAQQIRILDPAGTTLAKWQPPAGTMDRPEVDRAELRTLLINTLPHHTIAWGHQLERADQHSGRWQLQFASDGTAECDLLIGADGGRSMIRDLLTDAEVTELNTAHELWITNPDRDHPHVADMVGPSSLWCLGDALNLAAQRDGDGRIRVMVSTRTRFEPDLSGDWPSILAQLRQLYTGWESQVLRILDACDAGTIIPRTSAHTPIPLTWPHRADTTLIGDAAHLMPPVGEGANQAMLDAALLGQAIADHDDCDAALLGYEQEMFERTAEVARDSLAMEKMILSPTAATDMARFFG
jgi:2-polyprenyl-6-methoxyphenol hydroxylase-like FAD-dependent oxidoreductase